MSEFLFREFLFRELISMHCSDQAPLGKRDRFNAVLTISPSTWQKHPISVRIKKTDMVNLVNCPYILLSQDDSDIVNLQLLSLLKKNRIYQGKISFDKKKEKDIIIYPLNMKNLIYMRENKDTRWNDCFRFSLAKENPKETWPFLERYFINVLKHTPVRHLPPPYIFPFPQIVDIYCQLFLRALNSAANTRDDTSIKNKKKQKKECPKLDRSQMETALIRYLLEQGDDALTEKIVVGISKDGKPLYNAAHKFQFSHYM